MTLSLKLTESVIVALIVAGMVVVAWIITTSVQEAKGQVVLNEDQVLICLSSVWTDTANDISCKLYQQDDIDKMDMHEIYTDIMMEWDTFDISR
jgi:hypothetical protein